MTEKVELNPDCQTEVSKSLLEPFVKASNGLIRWFEAVGICVVMGVAEARTESWLITGLFWLAMFPPFILSLSAIASTFDRIANILGIKEDTIVPGNVAVLLNLVAELLGAIVVIALLFIVRNLVVAELFVD